MTTSNESSLAEWIAKNSRLILMAGGALIAVGVGVGVAQSQAHKKIMRASAALHEAHEKLEQELKLVGKTPVTDVDRQLAETVSALKKLNSGYPGTHAPGKRVPAEKLYSKYEPRSGKPPALNPQ